MFSCGVRKYSPREKKTSKILLCIRLVDWSLCARNGCNWFIFIGIELPASTGKNNESGRMSYAAESMNRMGFVRWVMFHRLSCSAI